MEEPAKSYNYWYEKATHHANDLFNGCLFHTHHSGPNPNSDCYDPYIHSHSADRPSNTDVEAV